MSQRKAKEYRQAMEQYRGVVEDVDDLKRRIGAMEARHRREDQLEISRRQARREAEKREANRAEYREHMRKINAEKRRRKIARQRIAFLACMAILALALVCALVTACSARGNGPAEEREINSAEEIHFSKTRRVKARYSRGYPDSTTVIQAGSKIRLTSASSITRLAARQTPDTAVIFTPAKKSLILFSIYRSSLLRFFLK